MIALGLSHGTTGNLSVRIPGGLLITPSGIAYRTIGPADLVVMDMDGTPAEGVAAPSSEWRIHRDVYAARPDVGAIVHAHPPHATAIACLRMAIPAVHYLVGLAGGDSIRCAEYATFGSAGLSANTVSALEGRTACLLANHGIVAVGANLTAALDLAHEVERMAELYWLALAAGRPVMLDPTEMTEVVERLRSYRK